MYFIEKVQIVSLSLSFSLLFPLPLSLYLSIPLSLCLPLPSLFSLLTCPYCCCKNCWGDWYRATWLLGAGGRCGWEYIIPPPGVIIGWPPIIDGWDVGNGPGWNPVTPPPPIFPIPIPPFIMPICCCCCEACEKGGCEGCEACEGCDSCCCCCCCWNDSSDVWVEPCNFCFNNSLSGNSVMQHILPYMHSQLLANII